MSFQKSEISQEVAKELIATKAVILRPDDPFTWTSGWKSPIYCDNRKTLSYPKSREIISGCLLKAIQHYYPEVEMVAGVATAGIPQASIIADRLSLPLVYIRDKAKAHGRENKIEGHLQGGEKTIVIEDLISTGGSSIRAAQGLAEAGGQVLGVLSTFSYGFNEAEQQFQSAGIDFKSLCTYRELLPIAIESGIVQKGDLALLESWREAPANWNG